MDDCIFCKIRDREIAKEFTYEDEDIMVFPDIHPVKPVHLLIVPKKHVADFVDISDVTVFEKVGKVAQQMVGKMSLEGKGYRLLVNGGGAQVVQHIHFHLLGPMGFAAKI